MTRMDTAILTAFDGAEALLRAWAQGLRPEPALTVSAWADRHRMLLAARAGRARAAGAPRARPICRRSWTRSVAEPSGAADRVHEGRRRSAAPRAGNNWLGFIIHHAPGPALAVQPTVELAKRFSRQRIDPLIEESPGLREKVTPARIARQRQHRALQGIPRRHPGDDRRQQGGRPALDAGALPVPRRGRRLPALGRRGRRSGRPGRGADADLRPPAQGLPGLDADDPGPLADRARVRGQRPAAVLRALPALRRDAVAARSSGCAGTRASPRRRPTAARPASSRSPSSTRRRCCAAASGGRPRRRRPADDRLPPLRALLARGLAELGADRAGSGRRAGVGRGQPRLRQHHPRRDLGRDRRGAGLAAALRTARGLAPRARCPRAGCS